MPPSLLIETPISPASRQVCCSLGTRQDGIKHDVRLGGAVSCAPLGPIYRLADDVLIAVEAELVRCDVDGGAICLSEAEAASGHGAFVVTRCGTGLKRISHPAAMADTRCSAMVLLSRPVTIARR